MQFREQYLLILFLYDRNIISCRILLFFCKDLYSISMTLSQTFITFFT